MDAKELRIGNYYHWEAEGKKYPMQVDAKDFSNDNYRNFEPIPLTEEWLLRLGFKKAKENNFYFGDLRYVKHDLKGATGYNNVVNYKGFPTTHVTYVHQLQNLYHALTGHELTIN